MKVVFLDTVHPILSERLQAAGYTCLDASDLSLSECQSAVGDATGIVIRSRFTMDSNFLQHAPQLTFIARSGAGMENIDVDYCMQRGILLHNAPEGNRQAVAEHALGMLLSLLNKLHTADLEVRNGKWDREGNRGHELAGKTIGIIGYGNNGSAFAQVLRGFDVRILAVDTYKQDFGNDFVEESSMSRLYAEADVVSFHIPQNEETMYLADTGFFEQFHKPIYLLNLSRGKIVRTTALVDALKTGRVLGAGLDVLEYEQKSFESFFQQELPAAFEYLTQSNRVILSPHVGGWTEESYYKLSAVLADKILAAH